MCTELRLFGAEGRGPGASAPTALVRGMVPGMRLVGRGHRAHWSGPCCPEESGICPCGRRVEAGQWRSCSRAVGHKRGRYPWTPGRNVHPGPDDAHSEGLPGVSLLAVRGGGGHRGAHMRQLTRFFFFLSLDLYFDTFLFICRCSTQVIYVFWGGFCWCT